MLLSSCSLSILTVAAGLVASAAVFSSCTPSAPKSDAPSAPPAAQVLAARGKAAYQSACIACHNSDPKKNGALGPEIWGASLELLEARILKAEYPPGYKPKRATHVMQPLPQVQKDIPALHAYLNSN